MGAEEYPLGRLGSVSEADREPTVIDTTVAHPARIYDYWLGGKDNFPADREAAERIVAMGLDARDFARANRAFLGRAVRLLAEQGIDQFLDIGTGIPAADNTHEVAQRVNPAARVVYVDNDPIVLAHARALMAGHGMGATTAIQADLRDPAAILAHPEVRAALDFDRPIGLLLIAVLHFVTEDDGPEAILKTLRDALPPGSYLAVSHATTDFLTQEELELMRDAKDLYKNRSTSQIAPRTRERVTELLTGFDLVEPGLVPGPEWRAVPDAHDAPDGAPDPGRAGFYGAVGRKI